MNIQLYIEGQLCDYDNKSYTTLQKEFVNEAELIVKEVEYSYTIEIPVTDRNNVIFGFKSVFDAPNKFSKVYNGELYVNEQLILRGKFRLTEIDHEYYKGNLYIPATKTVSDILGDRMLNEIIEHNKLMGSLSDYRQTNNYVIGSNTTDIPTTGYRDRHVCYPYILYGLPYNTVDAAIRDSMDFYTQSLKKGDNTITNDKIFPAFNVCSVLKDMFKTEGYNLVGNIFEDEKFSNLYQTFQGNAQDYLDKKEVPYYLKFNCFYSNLTPKTYGEGVLPCTGSPTMQVSTLWSEGDYSYKAGVDNPLVTDDAHSTINVYKNDQHMLTSGDTGARVIVIPKSGWYRIHSDGYAEYPLKMTEAGYSFMGIFTTPNGIWYDEKTDMYYGGYLSYGNLTSLLYSPFEFQIKKGTAQDNPRYYSFNSFVPCQPRSYNEIDSAKVWMNGWSDSYSCLKVPSNDSYNSRLYGKNGKQTIIKNYSDDRTSDDLLIGARLGGAYFGNMLDRGFTETNRHCYKGLGLCLPNTSNLNFKTIDGVKYFTLFSGVDSGVMRSYEYANQTGLVMLRDFTQPTAYTYSEFDGYNVVNWDTGTWDTTSNPYRTTLNYSGSESSLYRQNTVTPYASDPNKRGDWTMNTVVWLEKGDMINIEVVMPYHITGRYSWVNITNVYFTFEMGFISSDKKWSPTAATPIPPFNSLTVTKPTNVNKLLPQIKCNDYLNNFLQTFNLQLTHPSQNTFSIDYAVMNELMGDIIDIDPIVNIKDAEFKVLDSPSTRILSFKIDKGETGYVDGNKSTYKSGNYPWYESGYTGSVEITNDANTSGDIDKKESSWSYNWYKDIKFVGGDGLTPSTAPVPVICDSNVYSTDSSYGAQEGEQPQSNKTMRFFFLGKDENTNMYKRIGWVYDTIDGVNQNAMLLIPSNEIVTKLSSGNRSYNLDYSLEMGNNRKSITDIFFNLSLQSGYQVDVPVKMSNEMYSKIKAGTLVKLNDGIFRVKAIEGHDVSENEYATLSLLTLN